MTYIYIYTIYIYIYINKYIYIYIYIYIGHREHPLLEVAAVAGRRRRKRALRPTGTQSFFSPALPGNMFACTSKQTYEPITTINITNNK